MCPFYSWDIEAGLWTPQPALSLLPLFLERSQKRTADSSQDFNAVSGSFYTTPLYMGASMARCPMGELSGDDEHHSLQSPP